MKRIIASLTVFAGMWFVGSLPAWASCSNASLRGSYGFERQGFNPAVGHVGGIGVVTFDGNGNLSGMQTNVTETPDPHSGTGITRNTFTGTYEVNPDCTGSVVTGSTTLDFVIASDKEVFAITTTKDPAGAQRVVTWVLKKQLPQEGD